jgi:hypothetical protein
MWEPHSLELANRESRSSGLKLVTKTLRETLFGLHHTEIDEVADVDKSHLNYC